MAFKIKRGTNISHWLSQSQRRGSARSAYFQQADLVRLAGIGLDHIRLPIDEEQMWNELGSQEDAAFELLGSAIEWAAELNMKVIVDLHILRSHYFNQEGTPALYTDPHAAEKFCELWRELSEFLDQFPNELVAYELLNEPVARDPADWNRVARQAFDTIRDREPDRQIFLGSNWFQTCDTFDTLEVPNDPNITLACHYYNPMLITHHQASWVRVSGTYDGPIHYPGLPIHPEDFAKTSEEFRAGSDAAGWNDYFDISVMQSHFQKPLIVAARTGLPLHCGEFGVHNAAPLPIRQAWYRDIMATFAKYNISWSNWDYKGNFGIFDNENNPTGIHEAMGLDLSQ